MISGDQSKKPRIWSLPQESNAREAFNLGLLIYKMEEIGPTYLLGLA